MLPLTDVSKPGYFDVSVSPKGGFYVLSYKGPDVPWQRVFSAKAAEDAEDKVQLLEGNETLNKTLSEYARPIIDRTTVTVDDYGELCDLHAACRGRVACGRKLINRAQHAGDYAFES